MGAVVDAGQARAGAQDPSRARADTRLEVSVQRYGLRRSGLGVADPNFQLFLEVRARLVRAADNFVLYTHAWSYEGPRHPYFRWAGGDAALLRSELRLGAEGLAAEIARHMFAAPSPSRQERDVIDAARLRPAAAPGGAVRDRP
jgi:hypothetical protein